MKPAAGLPASCHEKWWRLAVARRALVVFSHAPSLDRPNLHENWQVVFGGEEAGLGNADLALCGARIEIPSDPACRSLNLAAAVQLVCYELRLAALDAQRPAAVEYAPTEAFDQMLGALDDALLQAGWYANKNRALALEKLRRLLQRARPDRAEVQLLRGAIERLRQP